MTPKTFSWILLVSLTGNALLGGWIIARSTHKHPRDPSHAGPTQGGGGPQLLRRLVGAAGGPRDPRFGELKGAGRPEFRKIRGAMAAAQARVDSELRTEPFSAERFEEAVRELQALEIQGIAGANELAVQLAPKMTPDERRQAGAVRPRSPR